MYFCVKKSVDSQSRMVSNVTCDNQSLFPTCHVIRTNQSRIAIWFKSVSHVSVGIVTRGPASVTSSVFKVTRGPALPASVSHVVSVYSHVKSCISQSRSHVECANKGKKFGENLSSALWKFNEKRISCRHVVQVSRLCPTQLLLVVSLPGYQQMWLKWR